MRALLGAALLAAATAQAEAPFPRLMGMNIGAKHYDDPGYQAALAKLDVVILGFYRGWNPGGDPERSAVAMREVVRALKARNPQLLVGQYTVLNEVSDDPRDPSTRDLQYKLDAERWWLRDAKGRKRQWTDRYATWKVNFTPLAPADAKGRRWPEWRAERDYAVFFDPVPELDIAFLDNVFARPRVSGDWDGDGLDDSPRGPKIVAAHVAGHRAHWRRLRELMPRALLIANVDDDLSHPEWRGALDGAFLEALMGQRWSLESWAGWDKAMARYRAVMRNTRAPHLVGFNVHGNPSDRRFFRYAFASCLMDDGYFSFTDESAGYGSVPWFEEYDIALGRALESPPAVPWRDGVWRRDFEGGIALVNPTDAPRTVEVEPGRRVSLQPKDGAILRRAGAARRP